MRERLKATWGNWWTIEGWQMREHNDVLCFFYWALLWSSENESGCSRGFRVVINNFHMIIFTLFLALWMFEAWDFDNYYRHFNHILGCYALVLSSLVARINMLFECDFHVLHYIKKNSTYHWFIGYKSSVRFLPCYTQNKMLPYPKANFIIK